MLHSFHYIDKTTITLDSGKEEQKQTIYIAGIPIALHGARIYDEPGCAEKPRPLDEDTVLYLKQYLNHIAHILGAETRIPRLDTALQKTRDIIRRHYRGIIGDREAVDQLWRMIGMGEGSTPSYDDYLGGTLYMYNLYNKTLGIDKHAPPLPGTAVLAEKTTLLSALSLNYLAKGYAPRPIAYTARTLLGCTGMEKTWLIEALGLGHSSGYYMALGVIDSFHTLLGAERY